MSARRNPLPKTPEGRTRLIEEALMAFDETCERDETVELEDVWELLWAIRKVCQRRGPKQEALRTLRSFVISNNTQRRNEANA